MSWARSGRSRSLRLAELVRFDPHRQEARRKPKQDGGIDGKSHGPVVPTAGPFLLLAVTGRTLTEMDRADLVALLKDGVTAKGGRWADRVIRGYRAEIVVGVGLSENLPAARIVGRTIRPQPITRCATSALPAYCGSRLASGSSQLLPAGRRREGSGAGVARSRQLREQDHAFARRSKWFTMRARKPGGPPWSYPILSFRCFAISACRTRTSG